MESTDVVDGTNGTKETNTTISNTDEQTKKEEQTKKDEQKKEEEPWTQQSYPVSSVGKTLRDGMDETNKKAFDALKTGDTNAFLKHVFTREDGTERSYAEMRCLYG